MRLVPPIYVKPFVKRHAPRRTETTVRAVDYQIVGATAPDQFRVYSDDERDVARWRRVETPESP